MPTFLKGCRFAVVGATIVLVGACRGEQEATVGGKQDVGVAAVQDTAMVAPEGVRVETERQVLATASAERAALVDSLRALAPPPPWVPAICEPQAVLGHIWEVGVSSEKRRRTSPGSEKHEVFVSHSTATEIDMRDVPGVRRGVDLTLTGGGPIPPTARWGTISLDAVGCTIPDPPRVAILKDGVLVPGSRYDADLQRVIAPIIGNSSYIIATPGDGLLPTEPEEPKTPQ